MLLYLVVDLHIVYFCFISQSNIIFYVLVSDYVFLFFIEWKVRTSFVLLINMCIVILHKMLLAHLWFHFRLKYLNQMRVTLMQQLADAVQTSALLESQIKRYFMKPYFVHTIFFIASLPATTH